MDINRLLSTVSSGYYVSQVLTIVFLCALGYVLIWAFCAKTDRIRTVLLSFPAGLSFYCVVIYTMLVINIRISVPGLILTALSVFISAAAGLSLYRKKRSGVYLPDPKAFNKKDLLILTAGSTVLACIAASGLLSVGLDNDSYYYFSTYPQMIIHNGCLKYEFDVLLTDVGPVAAVINTLPFVFGFSNTYGIQHFLNFTFLIIFSYILFFELKEKELSVRIRGVISGTAAVFLATCPAYLTTAKWIMAGDYFMVFFFLLAYFGYRDTKDKEIDMAPVLALFAFMVTMVRQEGPVMIAFLSVCFCILEVKGRRIALLYILPAFLAAGLYYLRIFVFINVRPLYAFLTRQKAVLILAMLLAAGMGVLTVKTKVFEGIQKKLKLFIILGVILLNLAMLAVNSERYLTNLYMFFMNVRLRNGWGYFGFVFFIFIVLSVLYAVIQKDKEISFFDVLMIGYILISVCAAWGRGDHLRLGTGDSGNRVMLTSVPVIVFAMTMRAGKIIGVQK
ncbi:MAG: hypothetical protein K6F86_09845 [Lachnospiraceae bacterium]|nr:hypothetical protein [Lachnospiraceae bacterium]